LFAVSGRHVFSVSLNHDVWRGQRVSVRTRILPFLGARVALLTVAGTAAASSPVRGNDWPYQGTSKHRDYTLVAVGDIACEPADAENQTTPDALKCGSPKLGGYDAEYATARQALHSFTPTR
jgi:hypothetical protein